MATIKIKIRGGDLIAEGNGFKGKSCVDKLAFLNKIGKRRSTTDKRDDPAPAPHVHNKLT